MIFILADSMDTAKQVAMACDVLPKNWRYVGLLDTMYAYRNQVLWLAHGSRNHPHCQEVLEQAKNRCFRIFELTEVPKYTL